MTQTDNSTSQSSASLSKRMLAGAAIGLLLITLYLFTADEPNPAWGTLWMIRPIVIVTMAGAMGGLCNYFIVHFHNRVRMNKIIAIILSVIIFIIGIWMGIVLGLDGTMWD